ncbi:hypothetical protein MMYC01_207851 [Madurella mycetomatis]|uniref:Heterokaryon incompatibility domain-containing protein n=1 Tax=Madurella mycetomatis TaxID=100816 RepID=A0A175W1M4_9PEZI|nr:hypothetical protein MMYC01_207851 [Madurella mycetomatis]
MDFLPHPASGVEPLDIPFVADTPYVFGTDFWDFPKSHGFGDQWASLPAPRLASLAQSWLYFGTISEFLGRPIDYRDFQLSRSVSAKPLLPLLDDWIASHAVAPPDSAPGDVNEAQGRKQVLHVHYRFLHAVIHLAEDFEKVSQSNVKPIPTIILSVKVLCITLRSVLWELAHDDIDETLKPWPSAAARLRHEIVPATDTPANQTLSPSAQLMLDVLRLRGWCPFYARKVLTTYNYAIAYYFTRLFRTYSPGLSHQGCSDDECVAGNADIFSYVPKHARYGCQCQPKSAPMDQIRAIIEEGGIPLIRLRGSSKTGVRIEVVRMTARTRFVVVSHVWSDGIGNANANSLPECQLRRLHAHISRLKPLKGGRDTDFNLLSSLDSGFQTGRARRPKYLWIDALCMPPGGPTAFLRLRAINKLPAVYHAADRVLVLDSTLEQTSVLDSDPLEQFARLAVSPWMGRCWTFQEAALAVTCEVQCADGTFDALVPQLKRPYAEARRRRGSWLESLTLPATWMSRVLAPKPQAKPVRLLNSGSTMTTDISTAMITSLARSICQEFRSAFANGVKPSKTAFGAGTLAPDFCTLFVQIWNELSKRATTVPGDMHIIMAALLGFNTEPLMKLAKSAERMSCILRSMDGIPMSLFFNLEGPRHNPTKNHRDRWVPLYPSRQKLTFGSTFTNLRSINSDLYLPNNSVSRTKVAVLVCTGEVDPFSSCIFTLRDTSSGEQYSVVVHREEGEVDAFATPEIGPYCVAIQLDPELGYRPEGHIDGLGVAPKTYAGALFRVRRVMTNVRKLYYHNIETDYENSFELVEEEEYGTKDFETASKNTTEYLDGNLGSAFARYQRGILRTVYDCPLTVSCVPAVNHAATPTVTSPDKTPTLAAQSLPSTWQVVIEREPPTYPVPLPSRPPYTEVLTPVSSYLLVTALDGLVASGCVGLAIALCATQFAELSLASRAAVLAKLALHAFFLAQLFLLAGGVEVRLVWDLFHLALVALYAVSRALPALPGAVGAGAMDVLDWAFVGFAAVGHTADFIARLTIRAVVVPRLFEKYVESFEGGDAAAIITRRRRGVGRWFAAAKGRLRRMFRFGLRFRFGGAAGGRRRRRRKGSRGYEFAGQVLHQDQQDHDIHDGMATGPKGYGRSEQHLLGDMERLV